MGERLLGSLRPLVGRGLLTEIRGAGLWLGLDVAPHLGTARDLCYRLMAKGVLAKDTHGRTIRFAPPLVISADDVDAVIDATTQALEEAERQAA